jgi:CheY-like chemotaxis protein
MNLAVNARDAMPNGGRLILETANVEFDRDYFHKHLAVQPAGKYTLLMISDTGSGMDEDTQAHIFEPFFTTKAYGKGTGLGLSTVYGIVKQSEGFIWVASEIGKGTTFKIYFPTILEEAKDLPDHQKQYQSLEGNETILLVEDEEMVRELSARILVDKGYKVLEASRGEEALEVAGKFAEKIQLMITDVVMPGMSGKKLAQQMKKDRPEMQVLFISGYTDDILSNSNNIDKGLYFLQKPFLPDHFLGKVREILDKTKFAKEPK